MVLCVCAHERAQCSNVDICIAICVIGSYTPG